MRIHQINLQRAFGGGEVYTRAFSEALALAGAEVSLYVSAENRYWDELRHERIRLVPARAEALAALLPDKNALLITQGPLPASFLEFAARRHILTGFAHMPLLERSAEEFRRYALVCTVSGYCVGLLQRAGLRNVYAEPLYGSVRLERRTHAELHARTPYYWDRRKLRDRLLGALQPLTGALRKPRAPCTFRKEPGLTLGLVSWISPIKQFPALFTLLAPRMAQREGVRLEIFGHGGYAQVRDLKRSLAPLGGRARFWGFHAAVQEIYPRLDYLMTGLPEKEALGLNVLESQACGTPVLAPDAPPFTETVLHGASGFLYRDPRADAGAGFARLLDELLAGRPRPDPRLAREHLARFSREALVARAARLLAHFAQRFPHAAP